VSWYGILVKSCLGPAPVNRPELTLVDAPVQRGGGEGNFFEEECANNFMALKS